MGFTCTVVSDKIYQRIIINEEQLSEDYIAINNMEEDEAILRIKSKSKAFFSFDRSKQKVRAKVGPFRDPANKKSNPSPDFAAEALRRQYDR